MEKLKLKLKLFDKNFYKRKRNNKRTIARRQYWCVSIYIMYIMYIIVCVIFPFCFYNDRRDNGKSQKRSNILTQIFAHLCPDAFFSYNRTDR